MGGSGRTPAATGRGASQWAATTLPLLQCRQGRSRGAHALVGLAGLSCLRVWPLAWPRCSTTTEPKSLDICNSSILHSDLFPQPSVATISDRLARLILATLGLEMKPRAQLSFPYLSTCAAIYHFDLLQRTVLHDTCKPCHARHSQHMCLTVIRRGKHLETHPRCRARPAEARCVLWLGSAGVPSLDPSRQELQCDSPQTPQPHHHRLLTEAALSSTAPASQLQAENKIRQTEQDPEIGGAMSQCLIGNFTSCLAH